MMELQTVIKFDKPDFNIDYDSRVMLLGSCFVENIGRKLEYFRFRTDINPCGIVYNPMSAAECLELLMEERLFAEQDLLEHGGKWVSLSHHGRFSSPNPEECLYNINQRLEQSALFLREARLLVITWGTSWVYRHLASGKVAANCHKIPASAFERYRLEVGTIVERYTALLNRLQVINPKLKILFTVSPIRHWKEGAHGNQLSKAVLLLAVDELVKSFPQAIYFPSYEVVMDELRDYRFYAEDMLHISPQGVEYIWEKFRELYFSTETRSLMVQVDRLNKILQHRALSSDQTALLQLQERALAELKQLGFIEGEEEFSVSL